MGISICDLCHKEIKPHEREYAKTGRHYKCEVDRREKEKEYQKSLKGKQFSR